MTTDLMIQRNLRTVNLTIDLHRKLSILKAEKDSGSMANLIEELYNTHIQKNNKFDEVPDEKV